VYICSLSYHYLLSEESTDLAFKYTVKAADQAIHRGAFSDGLNYVQTAAKISISADKRSILLRVVDRAIIDLEPKMSFSLKLGGSRKHYPNTQAVSASTPTSELYKYKAIREQLEQALTECTQNEATYKENELFIRECPRDQENAVDTKQTFEDVWEPSYTAGKTVKLAVKPSEGRARGCRVC
jgi:hypothetical protein